MKKRTFVVILLLVSGLALSIRCLPIIPMRFVYNVWIDHEQRLVCCFPRELDNYSIGRLVKILTDNGERYCVSGKTILIPLWLWLDKELLWNYTTKAGMPYPDSGYIRDDEYNLWKRNDNN